MSAATRPEIGEKVRTAAPSLVALAALIAILYFGRVFIITLTAAVIASFMLEPLVGLAMRLKMPRGLASFVVCSFALLTLYLAGVGVYTQVSDLMDELPAYSDRINELIDGVSLQMEEMDRTAYRILVPKRIQERDRPPAPAPTTPEARRKRQSALPVPLVPPPIPEVRIRTERQPLINYIYDYVNRVYSALLMASFVPFLVYFMLSWQDHLRRAYLHLFQGQERMMAAKAWEGIASMARAFVVGNFILGLLLAAVSSLFFWLMKLPYPLLIGPISGFLSLIPYIGLPLSILPPLVAALPIYKGPTMYLILGTTVAFFHLLALNLLYPKLVGSRVHLNPLVVTVALMFWGAIWGGLGLVLAIPLTAGIKAVCDTVSGLEPYGRLLGD
ncbi:MAG: AI-2E family transporter [Bryobacterales bacterium]|nr:AI-2E family transporter [Bryobacterales bacterium]